MRISKIISVLLVFVLLILSITGCAQPAATPSQSSQTSVSSAALSQSSQASASSSTSQSSQASAATGEPIKIGAVLPLSSAAAITGSHIRIGIETVMDQVNKAGGIKGRPIQVIFEDIQASDPALALSAVEKLINSDKVVLIIGCYGSSASLAALPKCEKAQIPMVEPNATSPALTTGSQWIFRLPSTNAIDAEKVAPLLPSLGFTKVAYLPVDNDWGLSVTKAYIPKLEAAGAKTICTEAIALGETNYLSQLTKIKNSGADSMIITQDADTSATLLKQIVEAGMSNFKVLCTSGNSSMTAYDLAGDATANTYFVEYFAQYGMKGAGDNPDIKALDEFMKKNHPDTAADYPVAAGINAANVVVDALKRAASYDGVTLRDTLRQTNISGLRGQITFDKNGQAAGEVYLTQLKAGGEVNVIKKF